MASLKELVELSNQGHIGELLVSTLGGELGHLYPREDSEFIIEYPDESMIPTTVEIKETIEARYTAMGYILVNMRDDRENDLWFNITLPGDEPFRCVNVVIGTHFPNNGHRRNVRVTTSIQM